MLYDTNIRALCDGVQQLRESVMRRLAAINCCDLDNPEAAKAVTERIAYLLFDPDAEPFRNYLANHNGERKVMDLLVLDCATAAQAAAPPQRKQRPYYRGEARRKRPDLVAMHQGPKLAIDNTQSGAAQ